MWLFFVAIHVANGMFNVFTFFFPTGCMAERLKKKIVEREQMVDVVCGPDAYRDLPHLLASSVSSGHAAGTAEDDSKLLEHLVSMRSPCLLDGHIIKE